MRDSDRDRDARNPACATSCRYESEGRKKPKIVPDLEHLDVVSVECGGMHTAVLTRDGKVSPSLGLGGSPWLNRSDMRWLTFCEGFPQLSQMCS